MTMRFPMAAASVAMLLWSTGTTVAAAAPRGDAGDSAKVQYEAERARCIGNTTGQDQASCLKSAGAAYDAARGNRLQDPNTNFDGNALVRCKNVPEADRADCESRVGGAGTSSGSVKGGGIVKETVTRTGPADGAPATR